MARQARKTAAQVAQKWGTNLGNSTQQIMNGVNGVTVAPTQLAAAQAQAYVSGVQNAVSSGKWQSKLQAVSLGAWQNAMKTKGVPRVQQAASTDQPKVQAAFGPLLDYVYNLRDQVNSTMPRGSLAQNIQRMNSFVQGMHAYKSGG
jgi:hypothetical protein